MTLSPEQAAKREERRARFREFVDRLGAMSEEQRQEIVAHLPGLVTPEGHLLSDGNACLVFFQRPTATMVGGFKQWIKNGRCVRKGESGLMIWIPTQRKQKEDDDPNTPKRAGFIVGNVFDISQTDPIGGNNATVSVQHDLDETES